MKSRPTKQKLKQRGILRERVFGCDLGEHLLNSGHDVPQVLKSCTEFIEKHGVVDGMYRLSGIASNIQKLRHEFDSEQIPDLTKDIYIQDIHCVGSLCKLYFRELPNPLLTYQLYEKFSEAVSAATDEERLIKIHDVIQQLPPPHYRTLEFLMRHLSQLATFSYITNMHSKNLAIVWAPNLLRSKQIESACFSGTAAFMEVRIQSVVVEFILNHVDVLFSPKLSSLIREGAGHNSLSRPKSLLVSSPSTKLLSLEEAQARTQAQINSPVTEDSKYIEVGEGPAALQGKFHTVIEFPTERKRPPIKTKKSPVGSWRSFFNLGKSSSMTKRKLHRNPSEPNELKAMALAGGRGDTATLRSAKSEESLSSLHNVEGESKVYRPRRPRSSSDALSASFNGELLDSRQHCNSYDNLDGTEDSDGDDGPICVPALISPPRSAGEDVDLSPPDIGMASLDFDPMSFQCSMPDTSGTFPLEESLVGAEASTLKRSKTNVAEVLSASFLDNMSTPVVDFRPIAGEKRENKKMTISYSYMDKPTQAVSPIKSGKSTSVTGLATADIFSAPAPNKSASGHCASSQPLPPPSLPKDSSVMMGSVLLRPAEASLTEAFQMELQSKLAAIDSEDKGDLKGDNKGVVSSDSSREILHPSHCTADPAPAPLLSHMTLALSESFQPVSVQSPSEPLTPITPMTPSPQDCPALIQPLQPASEIELEQNGSPLASNAALTLTSVPSFEPCTSTPVRDVSGARSNVTEAFGRAASSTTPPQMDTSPPDTPVYKCAPLVLDISPHNKSPERLQASQVTTASSTTPTTTPTGSFTAVKQPTADIMKSNPEPVPPPTLPKPVEVHASPASMTQKVPVSLPQSHTSSPTKNPSQNSFRPQTNPAPSAQSEIASVPQSIPESLLPQPGPQSLPQPPLISKASARVVPTAAEPIEKPWEAIKPVQPSTESHAPKPPAPPVRTMESKLATAALSQSEAPFHVPGEGHPDELVPRPPLSPRKPSTHQPPYMYRTKAEPLLIELPGSAYYQQRPAPIGPQSIPHHYRADNMTPHPSHVSKSEPQIPYSARLDNRYSTLGPRSYHHSIKSRGNPRGVAPGHQVYTHDRTHGYATIRRVHSMHVPSTIRSVPIQRTEVPPDDELFFCQRPVYPCKAYHQQQQQQQPQQQQSSSSQADYHVTQLQPYFENGRVQYRYSPYSGSGPVDAPFYDIDPYGTIRVRHFHSHREPGPGSGRPRAKTTGYHYLSNHTGPPAKEHSFVSRDIPPSHGAKESAYHTWDAEECERYRIHSIRRESRARQKIKGPVLSQYDNVGLVTPSDISGYETLHLRSKSDPGKAVLVTAESKDGRYVSRHVMSDPEALMYLETEKQFHGSHVGERSDGIAKPSGTKKVQSSHSLSAALSHSVSHQQEISRHTDDKLQAERSKYWQQEHSNKRSLQPRYDCPDPDHLQNTGKTVSGYHSSEDQPREQVSRKPERSHSVREQNSQGKPDLDREYVYQKLGMKTAQSHYDNLDDYHPAPQVPAPKRGAPGSYPPPGFTVNLNRAYSTALGQGAFIQTELGLQRPETEIRTE